jgi:ADP-ribosylglycohydrolase
MIKVRFCLFTFLLLFLFSCTNTPKTNVEIPAPKKQNNYGTASLNISKEKYYDKVLGALVGSAIGDAMGASTEMWHRSDIQKKYGYINGLTPALREKSPEGTWQHNMIAGATTDDTRWKYFTGQYFSKFKGDLSADHFALFISDYYQSLTKGLADKKALNSTDILDEELEKVNWIKEWARVSMAYQKGGTEYQKAQNRFYGGEMSCAGMLYSPMFGLITPSIEAAYKVAYDHAIFDIGYAKDISGIVAAMTNMAMQTNDIDSILNTNLFVDPYDYKNSRLIGRLAYSIVTASSTIIDQSKNIVIKDTAKILPPTGYPGSKTDWIRQNFIYEELEKQQKAIPFHAGEIWQITYTGLEFGEGDFRKTMAFIVNCGRDNDTVAAVAGMILGAKDGYSNLPKDLKEEILKVNKEVIGIDLELLANEITGAIKG